MTYENVLLQHDGAVATITVNRPKALNALNPATLDELLHCCEEVRHNREVHCVVVTGSGEKAFVAGADIAAMADMPPIQARAFARRGQRLMQELEELPIPVIAAVNGFALGGGLELALACDLIIASQSAKFGQPEINLGIIPGFGGTQRLSRRIGIAAARLMIYSGDMIGAEEALRLGLASRVVAPADLMPEVQKLAASLAGKAPIALQQAKAAINVGVDVDLQDGCRYEAEAFAVTFASDDRTEGMRAFLEKRRPTFKGV
ncbi:MAG: enoyl-CoA hydratase-related protein [Candidatus Binatia bacterium]